MQTCSYLFSASANGLPGRFRFLLAAALGLLLDASAWGQPVSVQASIDNHCSTHEARFVVPPGQVARGFTFDSLRAGLRCTTRTQIDDLAWGIANQDPRSGNVYYYNHNRNGTIFSLTNNRTTPLPLSQLVLPAGAYHAHVDGGINASVTIAFRLEPAAGGPAPAAFPGGIVWRFGRTDGSVIATRVQLLANGVIQGYSHPNEHHWGLENGTVAFYNAVNQATTRFLSNRMEGGVVVLRGAFLPDPSITHVLTEMGRTETAQAAGNPGGTSAVAATTPSAGPMEADTDMMGYDIGSLDLATASPAACQAECLRTPNCRAWTYVKPDTKQGPRPRCWLKNPVPGRSRDACCISGVVNRP